jgi:hypothetical protein
MDARTRTLHSADSTGVLTLTAPNAPDTLMLAPSGAHSGALVTIPVHTLESARAEAWQTLKQARAQQIAEPLNTHYGVFDADAPAQQSLIQAAAQAHTVQAAAQVAALAAAQAAGTTPAPERMQNWTLDWTLADNSAVALDAKALLDVTGALFERTQALHQRTQQLRAALEAASSVAEVMALKAAGLKLEPNNPLK